MNTTILYPYFKFQNTVHSKFNKMNLDFFQQWQTRETLKPSRWYNILE